MGKKLKICKQKKEKSIIFEKKNYLLDDFTIIKLLN
jgi:hypothetical protein